MSQVAAEAADHGINPVGIGEVEIGVRGKCLHVIQNARAVPERLQAEPIVEHERVVTPFFVECVERLLSQ